MKSWDQAQKPALNGSIREDFSKESNIFEEESKNGSDKDLQSTKDTALFNINEDENVIDIATPYKV